MEAFNMEKSKLLALGLIALVLVGGLVLASCGLNLNCVGGGSSIDKGACTFSASYVYDYVKGGSLRVNSYKDCNDTCITIQRSTDVNGDDKYPGSMSYYCTCQ